MKKSSWSEQDDAFFGPTPSTKAKASVSSTNSSSFKSNNNINNDNKKRIKKKVSASLSKASDWFSNVTVTLPPRQQPPICPRIPTTTSKSIRNGLLSQIPLQCIHCGSIPGLYKTHPFFGPRPRVCASHDESTVNRCEACQRYLSPQQVTSSFNNSNNERILCRECQTSTITTSEEVQSLYLQVLQFLSTCYSLNLFSMPSIPIHLVDYDAMNPKDASFQHPHLDGGKARGMCFWYQSNLLFGTVPTVDIGKMLTNTFQQIRKKNKKAPSTSTMALLPGASRHATAARNVSITAIFVLKGLPASLTGAILAHEAIHAWLALNPMRSNQRNGRSNARIPSQIEEGCCQLASHLYLQSILKKNVPTKEKELNQYFSWEIETHTSEIYGDGFRKVAQAYQQICKNGGGFCTLLEYVSVHLNLPPLHK